MLVVGGGLGGLACAQRLARRGGDLDVQLVDRSAERVFRPSLPWVAVGRRRGRAGEASRPLAGLEQQGVGFIQREVTGIELEDGAIRTNAGRIPYDQLVLAPGAALAPESVEGLAEAAHGFYTLADAERLREALVAFGGSRVLIVAAATPYRSLAAPYEAAFLIEELLRRRGALWHRLWHHKSGTP